MGESDEEKKGDDGVPDMRMSSKVSLHSDKNINEPLLTGEKKVNLVH